QAKAAATRGKCKGGAAIIRFLAIRKTHRLYPTAVLRHSPQEHSPAALDEAAKEARPELQTLILTADAAGNRFDAALARALPQYSRSRLRTWIDAGRVTLDDRIVDATRKVRGGERVVVRIERDADESATAAEPMALEMSYEDAAVSVVDKPAGLVVHPGSGNRRGTLQNALLHHAPRLSSVPRAGIVHRLDKETSGLLVVAKTVTAQTALVRQLAPRSVKRQYLALASGDIARGGTVDAPIGRHPIRRTTMAVVATGKAARTHYDVVGR